MRGGWSVMTEWQVPACGDNELGFARTVAMAAGALAGRRRASLFEIRPDDRLSRN